MRRFIFLMMMATMPFFSRGQEVYKEKIATILTAGDAAALSDLFIANIDLTLLETDDVFSRQQAKMILQKFFRDHPPTNFRYKHEGKSKLDAYYFIGNLSTGNGEFRVTFFLSGSGDAMQIKQLRIEQEP